MMRYEKGAVLVITCVMILLLTVISRYIGYEAISALREAKIQKDEVELRSSMLTSFQLEAKALIQQLKMGRDIDAISIGIKEGCRSFFSDNKKGFQRAQLSGQKKVVFELDISCRANSNHEQYQLWLVKNGLGLKGEVVYNRQPDYTEALWVNVFGSEYRIQLIAPQNEQECQGSCNQLALRLDGNGYHEEIVLQHDDAVKWEQPNYFLALAEFGQSGLFLLDRFGGLWQFKILSGGHIDYQRFGYFDLGRLQREELVRFLTYMHEDQWHFVWGFKHHVYKTVVELNKAQYYPHFSERYYRQQGNVILMEQDGISNSLESINKSWKINLGKLQLDDISLFNGVALLARLGSGFKDEEWLWLLSRNGAPLYHDGIMAHRKESEGLEVLSACSYKLRPEIVFDNWQIGCKLPEISHLQFVY